MSTITDYDTLKTAVARWLKRDNLDAFIPDYISFGENRLWYGDVGQFPTLPLRLKQMQATDDTNSIGTDSTIPLQRGYIDTISLRVNAAGRFYPLRYLAPQQFSEYESENSDPNYYTFKDGSISVAPLAGGAYRHDYYAKEMALSAADNENDLLTNFPELYLWAACIEGCLDIQNHDLAAQFSLRLSGRLSAIQTSDFNTAAGGSLGIVVGR